MPAIFFNLINDKSDADNALLYIKFKALLYTCASRFSAYLHTPKHIVQRSPNWTRASYFIAHIGLRFVPLSREKARSTEIPAIGVWIVFIMHPYLWCSLLYLNIIQRAF